MSRLALLSLALSLAIAPACSHSSKADKAPVAKGDSSAQPDQAAQPDEPAEPALPAVGQPAPAFTAVAHDGTEVSTEALEGEPFVLYFYPRDDTPG